MQENVTDTNEELIKNVQEELRYKFEVETEYIGEGKLGIEEFNGYIDSEEHCEVIEELSCNLCEWLRIKFDNDFEYQLVSDGYEIVIQII